MGQGEDRTSREIARGELERIYKERKEWLSNPEKYCDWKNRLCRMGWSDSYIEEILIRKEILDGSKSNP